MCYDCWGFSDDTRRDFRRGKTEPFDGFEETPHKKTKKKPKKKREGCPENDGNGHVYVWVTERVTYMREYETTRYVCCGCGKRHPRRRGTWKRVD